MFMEKDVAVSILEEIQDNLRSANWKQKTLKTIKLYEKNLEISSNEKIKALVDKYNRHLQAFGESDKRTMSLLKKIDKEIVKINNKYNN